MEVDKLVCKVESDDEDEDCMVVCEAPCSMKRAQPEDAAFRTEEEPPAKKQRPGAQEFVFNLVPVEMCGDNDGGIYRYSVTTDDASLIEVLKGLKRVGVTTYSAEKKEEIMALVAYNLLFDDEIKYLIENPMDKLFHLKKKVEGSDQLPSDQVYFWKVYFNA